MAAKKHRRRKHRSADTFVRENTRRGLTELGFRHAFRTRASGLRAFTRVELLAVLAVLSLLVLLLGIPALARAKAKRQRVACIDNLKTVGLAVRLFPLPSGGEPPWRIEDDQGGTLSFAGNPNALWRHFATLSNDLETPLVLHCPADRERVAAKSWVEFTNNRFLSYTLGLSASEEQPQSILSTDRNLLLDGAPLTDVVVSFRTNANLAWDRRIHRFAGNALLGDGSVQQVTSGRLRDQFRDAFQAVGTNTLVIP